jgi:hypothetical protein
VFKINCGAWHCCEKAQWALTKTAAPFGALFLIRKTLKRKLQKITKFNPVDNCSLGQVYAAYLHVSEVLAVMTSIDPIAKFISDDGVVRPTPDSPLMS